MNLAKRIGRLVAAELRTRQNLLRSNRLKQIEKL